MINSLRSVRKFKAKKIENVETQKIIRAGTMAASSSNSQPWHFIVVSNKAVKSGLGEIFLNTWISHVKFLVTHAKSNRTRQIYEESTDMVRQTAMVPLLIIACIDRRRASRNTEAMYASIYPAVQNIMLAAWSLGIGSCLTTNGVGKARGEAETLSFLRMPLGVKIAATIYLGYPVGKLSRPHRRSVDEVIHQEKW